ncbi:MAG: hypothetical protein AAF991_12040, partial [Pseudomonadota bacterium]
MLRLIKIAVSALSITGCGGFGAYQQDVQARVTGLNASAPPQQALKALLTDPANSASKVVTFCEADAATGACLANNTYPSASGLGGVFLPLTLELRALESLRFERNDEYF